MKKVSICIIVGLLFSLAFTFTLPAPIFAKIYRSCQAYYEVEVYVPDVWTTSFTLQLGHFSAKRGCGRTVPNRCRRRARDAAHNCMQTHWEYKDTPRTPDACKSNGVQDYNIVDLKSHIEIKICQEICAQVACYDDGPYDVEYSIYRVTSGDKGCGPDKAKMQRVEMAQEIRMLCPEEEDKEEDEEED